MVAQSLAACAFAALLLRHMMHMQHPALAGVSLALRDIDGHVLDVCEASTRYSRAGKQHEAAGMEHWVAASTPVTTSALQSLRFLNGEMYYSAAELRCLMATLAASPHSQREDFFHSCLSLRRRQRTMWLGTPLERVFTPEEKWDTLRPRALIEAVKAELIMRRGRRSASEALHEVFEKWDKNRDRVLDRDELRCALSSLRLGFSGADLAYLIKEADKNGDDLIDLDEFCEVFAIADPPPPPEQEDFMAMDGPWPCQFCPTLAANPAEKYVCIHCSRPRPGCGFQSMPEAGQWECNACHFYNENNHSYCKMCSVSKDNDFGNF